MFSERAHNRLDFNIDNYINPFIPPNFASVFPQPIRHFLGVRNSAHKEPPSIIQWILCFIATVAAICTVGAVYNTAPGIEKWHPPTLVASLGASAVLYYNAVASPLGQPRNSIVGQTISALVGTAITKLFRLDPVFFSHWDWVAASVACACASVAMSITNSVHPPGGATAILAASDKTILALGWMFPPIILLGTVLMLGIACLFNNTLRRFPTFWWTSAKCGTSLPLKRNRPVEKPASEAPSSITDVEKGGKDIETSSNDLSPVSSNSEDISGMSDSQRTLAPDPGQEIWHRDGLDHIHIAPHRIMLPAYVELSNVEADVLRTLMMRLQEAQ